MSALSTTPSCPCGAPVCPDLLEIRDLFPALSPDLCTACYDAASREDQAEAIEQAERTENRERLARLATIPPEILETSTGHVAFNVPLWLAVCEWHPRNGRWLLIHGLPGRCKTRVVGLLAKKLILEGYRVAWAPACEMGSLVDDLRSHDRTRWEPARAKLREWKLCELLVIDDIGKNMWTPALEAELFTIIDHRKNWRLPTILTSNEALADLLRLKKVSMERGAPIVSRVLEAARGWTFEAPEIQRRTNAGRGEAA